MDNEIMKITDYISANLKVWIASSKELTTIKEVAAKSKVSFGTIQRIRNGEGNPTITNLHDIAMAFGRNVEDLIAPIEQSNKVVKLPVPDVPKEECTIVNQELFKIINDMDDSAQWQLLGMAKILARTNPRQKNHVN